MIHQGLNHHMVDGRMSKLANVSLYPRTGNWTTHPLVPGLSYQLSHSLSVVSHVFTLSLRGFYLRPWADVGNTVSPLWCGVYSGLSVWMNRKPLERLTETDWCWLISADWTWRITWFTLLSSWFGNSWAETEKIIFKLLRRYLITAVSVPRLTRTWATAWWLFCEFRVTTSRARTTWFGAMEVFRKT